MKYNFKAPVAKAALALVIVGGSAVGLVHSAPTTHAAASSSQDSALQTLNSFYKPALKGQFPGTMASLTVGVSSRKDVQTKIGKPEEPAKDADGFDLYSANMGQPGYAVSYKLNKIHELRYFGTNVERQTNIGGITKQMLVHGWGAPNASVSIKAGSMAQQKLTYVRGSYQLEFIFNSSTKLDHINLTKKTMK